MTAHRQQRDAFISAAAEVCRLCEDAARLGGERLLVALDVALPRLHAAAAALPYPDDADEIPGDDLDVDAEKEAEAVAASLRSAFDELRWDRVRDELDETVSTADEAIDELDQLWEDLRASGSPALPAKGVQDQVRENLRRYLPDAQPRRPPAEAVDDVVLFDDLMELHADLREGFRLLEAGRPEAEAVFHWRLTFWSHWGSHLVEALRVVHAYVASESLAG